MIGELMPGRHESPIDLVYDVREVRIQAVHVDGEDPSISAVDVFYVTDSGQWSHVSGWTVGPFDDNNVTIPQLRRTLHEVIDRLID
jgi:hypothetical protein